MYIIMLYEAIMPIAVPIRDMRDAAKAYGGVSRVEDGKAEG